MSVQTFSHGEKVVTSLEDSIICNVSQVDIEGPNLSVSKEFRTRVRSKRYQLRLSSSEGTLRVNSKVSCPEIELNSAENVVISSTINTSKLTANSSKSDAITSLEGRIFSRDERSLEVILDTNVQTSVDSRIGNSVNFRRRVETLSVAISGNLSNFGKIRADERVLLEVGGNYFSPNHTETIFETAQRGFSALLKLNEQSPRPKDQRSSFSGYDPNRIAAALETGFDLEAQNVPTELRKVKLVNLEDNPLELEIRSRGGFRD